MGVKFKKMNKQRLAILIVAGLGALATFLPWAKIPGGTALHGEIFFTLGLFSIAILISLSKDKTESIKGGLLYAAMIPGILAVAIGLKYNSEMPEKAIALGVEQGGKLTIGSGLYLVVLAGIALPIVGFLIKEREEVKEKEEVSE